MKCRHFGGMVITVLCLGAITAAAQDYYYLNPQGTGPYFRMGAGPSIFQDGKLKQFGSPMNSSVQYDTGLAMDIAFGYAFNRYFSADFETGYIGTDINSVSGFNSDNSSLYNVPLLVNFTVSAPIPRTNIIPYAGVGAGGAVSVFDTDNLNNGSDYVYGRESDAVFAWQAFAGLRFMLNPQFSLGVGYKFFATRDPTFSYPSVPPGSPNWDVGFDGVRTHSILVTLQLDF